MASRHIHPARLQTLNKHESRKGDFVLYWMQQSQRAEDNHALEYAVQQANALGLPLRVVFGLTDGYPEANARHYRFLLEGLRETAAALQRRKVAFTVLLGRPDDVALRAAERAALLVCDRGYLRHQKQWRARVAAEASCPVVQVETDVVVPVEVASNKAEYAARTLRPKIHRHLEEFLQALTPTPLERDSTALAGDGLDLEDVDALLSQLQLDRGVPPVPHVFRGGTREARRRLKHFVGQRLDGYDDGRGEPAAAHVSHLSPYLHFGQIAPLTVALAAREASDAGAADRAAFLEELIVRRELAMNFVHFTEHYDRFAALPDWARKTLEKHAGDPRPHRYSVAELEDARTHDDDWNAAMRVMKYAGYLHNTLRMYWGKKVLEWSASPEEAYHTALALNNKYFLDGRDANSFTNVGWLFGLHDRPWQERPIFGTVRYMSAGGLHRKYNMPAYHDRVRALVAEAREHGVRFAGD